MSDLRIRGHGALMLLGPDSLIGALIYLGAFVLAALLLSRLPRRVVHAAMTREGHVDRTRISFVQQLISALIWVVMLITYAHLTPVLRAMGTALLAGAGVASVVIGLAAQSTLGNPELKLRAPDTASLDAVRGTLLSQLSRRFAQVGLGGPAAAPPSFS